MGKRVRLNPAALVFGCAMVMGVSATELDTIVARVRQRLEPITTFEAHARILECG